MNELNVADWAGKRRRAVWGMCLSGVLMGLSIMGSAAYVVMGMNGAFEALDSSGITSPDALGRHIGEVFVSAAIGILLFLVGFVALIVCLVSYLRLRKAERQRGMAQVQ